MNSKLKNLLNLWPQIVAGYHKRCDHVWEIGCEFNVLAETSDWYLKHNGYCHPRLEFGPFASYEELKEWDGENLLYKMLDICKYELTLSEDPDNDRDMPSEHWRELIEKLENNE